MDDPMSRTAARRLCPLATSSFAVIALLGPTGCYSYTYHLRGPPPDLQRVAIENRPHTEIRWSSWWGTQENEWSPLGCAPDATGRCRQVPHCDKGLGQVQMKYTAATFLMSVVTLGTAVPMRVSAWCATDSGPRRGP